MELLKICHEIDLLDGIQFTDKAIDIYEDVDSTKRLEIRRKYPHTIISKTEPFIQKDLPEKNKN